MQEKDEELKTAMWQARQLNHPDVDMKKLSIESTNSVLDEQVKALTLKIKQLEDDKIILSDDLSNASEVIKLKSLEVGWLLEASSDDPNALNV